MKTVLDKIVHAIREQPPSKNSSSNSENRHLVSRMAIVKYLKTELQYDNPSAIQKALKKGCQTGLLTQQGQSFYVTKDPPREKTKEEDEAQLEITDIEPKKKAVAAAAAVAQLGDTVDVKYVGKLSDGHVFDRATSFEFTLGAGEVIKGWDQGILGMQVGRRRKLVVPPKWGYGKRGCSPDIPPNATLYFDITLKQITNKTT